LDRNGLLEVRAHRGLVLVDIANRRKPQLPGGLYVPGLLNEDAPGVFEQGAFHEKQRAVVLETMDHDDVVTLEVVAGLSPFELLVEARGKAQVAKRDKFGPPALFPAMNLGHGGIHISILFLALVAARLRSKSRAEPLEL